MNYALMGALLFLTSSYLISSLKGKDRKVKVKAILSYLGLGTEGSSKYGFERQPIFFYGRKKVRLFNTLNRTMEEATLQRGKSIRLAIRFVKNYIHLIRNIESYRSKLLEFREHSKENASWDKLFSSQNEK